MEEMNQLNGTQKLPNANLVLILGILSIITCCCYGVIGLILGIVALVLAKKDKAMYLENPQAYSNYSNLNIGRILAIIGIVLSILYFVYMIWLISAVGMEALQDPELMQEKVREMMGK